MIPIGVAHLDRMSVAPLKLVGEYRVCHRLTEIARSDQARDIPGRVIFGVSSHVCRFACRL
jgi:hypothetical protein